MDNKQIEFHGVTKVYPSQKGPVAALSNVDLRIGQGEYVGIAGRNGSGKSTLARLMNGLLLPTDGRVLVNGYDTAGGDGLPVRSLVGMVFQNPDNQIISPLVEEEVAFGPENLGLATEEIKSRVEWALALVGMENCRHHSPHLLSGGQKQRLAIAAVLAMKPAYLVLDEPTSMLDSRARRSLINQLGQLNRKLGLTIILISHHIEDLVETGRLLGLDRGRVCLDGKTAELCYDVDRLARCGLKPPEIVRLILELRRRGHRIEEKITGVDQLVDFLCR